MAKNKDSDKINRIPVIVAREICKKHAAPKTRPCWYVYTSHGGRLPAVCNDRAIRAGYVGKISASAIGKSRYGQ